MFNNKIIFSSFDSNNFVLPLRVFNSYFIFIYVSVCALKYMYMNLVHAGAYRDQKRVLNLTDTNVTM